MGSYMNFKNFGEGDGGKQPVNFPLARQQSSSIYNLTFGELQNTFSSLGKDIGSMNMDELLKNLWNVEETQSMQSLTNVRGEGQFGNLQKQGSLTLPRTLSTKTVDEVWRHLFNETSSNGVNDSSSNFREINGMEPRQQTLGEMTLEEFLVKAGVVREDPIPISQPNDGGFYGELMLPDNHASLNLGFQQPNHNTQITPNKHAGLSPVFQQPNQNSEFRVRNPVFQQPNQNTEIRVNHCPNLATDIGALGSLQQPKPLFSKQANMAFTSPVNLLNSPQVTDPFKKNVLANTGGLGTGVVKVGGAGSPVNQYSPVVIAKSDVSTSPSSFVYNQGTRGRKSSGGFEKVVERRHRRMIKNRESAARSRARKQAYTLELEAEIATLKERNEELQKKQTEIMERQKNETIERMKLPWGAKRICLRRTLTGPW